MSEIQKENEFIGFEYKDVMVRRGMESVYADGYANFGWTLEDSALTLQSISTVTMKFKRDRKIRNKAELSRLQRQFDSCVAEIQRLTESKTTTASIAAYAIGIVGAAFMAGAVFAFQGALTLLFILLAIPGVLGFILPYFSFVSIRRKKTEQVMPLIDAKYDEIYELCKKANALLA